MKSMGKTKWFGIFTVLLVFAATPRLAVGTGDLDALRRKLDTLSSPPGNAKVGISVVDVSSGETIFAKNGDTLMNPASNAKIITAACALKTLGPEYRFTTSIHGRRDGSVIRGPIYLKGHADPTLTTKDLWRMVRALTSSGVRRIEGGVVVDDTFFDRENLPYAYDQQKNEDAAFRAPTGAVSLNHNTVQVTISPGVQAMSKARVFVEPPGFGDLNNDTVTVTEGAASPKISITRLETRSRIRVWGQIPLGARPVTYTKRIDSPSHLAGHGLKAVLESSGIAVGGGVQTGVLPPGTPTLATHRSNPLSAILYASGKTSNNFVTETVLKTIGAEASKEPGTWLGSIERAEQVLSTWGLEKGSYQYRNGSGLFDANRFSANQFVTVLRAVAMDTGIRSEFMAQLATGGVDGTLASRYQGAGRKRHVRAKTGTLADVSTLSGYVSNPDGTRLIAFSILVNNAPGYVSAARSYQEKLVSAIADFLNK